MRNRILRDWKAGEWSDYGQNVGSALGAPSQGADCGDHRARQISILRPTGEWVDGEVKLLKEIDSFPIFLPPSCNVIIVGPVFYCPWPSMAIAPGRDAVSISRELLQQPASDPGLNYGCGWTTPNLI